ncbi:somatomedin-B and thrombospondin type-1 domain-containing protein-like isoform X2 [Carettochelys insculpta]|uniref:somatomedin-B and thrombospondin type-1 domain-containing protein-like isoform X2 n=1 Tax=Carettochelys insculpta TaxID=44489 RepID=UPI003EC0B503
MARRPGWVAAALLLLLLAPGSEAGCAELGRCCPGRDLACVSSGWRPDRSQGACYCDQACARTMDCCHDYPRACPEVSCAVSEWSDWSGCAEPCRATYRVRRRHIVQEPRNGGAVCPPLEEKAGCVEYWNQQGVECKQYLSTVSNSSSWLSQKAVCRGTVPILSGCGISVKGTLSAWSVSTQPWIPGACTAMGMGVEAKGTSCCTGRPWGILGAEEPGGEFASWTLAPVLLFTVSCSSDTSELAQCL